MPMYSDSNVYTCEDIGFTLKGTKFCWFLKRSTQTPRGTEECFRVSVTHEDHSPAHTGDQLRVDNETAGIPETIQNITSTH